MKWSLSAIGPNSFRLGLRSSDTEPITTKKRLDLIPEATDAAEAQVPSGMEMNNEFEGGL